MLVHLFHLLTIPMVATTSNIRVIRILEAKPCEQICYDLLTSLNGNVYMSYWIFVGCLTILSLPII